MELRGLPLIKSIASIVLWLRVVIEVRTILNVSYAL